MSHHVYQSNALILESRNSRERDKSILVFVRELGVIRATAQGVRDIKSKLRSGLVELAFVHMNLVRGKEVWRIINLAPLQNFYYELKATPAHLHVVTRIASVLKRLVKGEEKNTELFDVVENLCTSISRIPESKLPSFEALGMIRIMHMLGYVGETTKFAEFINSSEWSEELLTSMDDVRTDVIKEINRALRESNL